MSIDEQKGSKASWLMSAIGIAFVGVGLLAGAFGVWLLESVHPSVPVKSFSAPPLIQTELASPVCAYSEWHSPCQVTIQWRQVFNADNYTAFCKPVVKLADGVDDTAAIAGRIIEKSRSGLVYEIPAMEGEGDLIAGVLAIRCVGIEQSDSTLSPHTYFPAER